MKKHLLKTLLTALVLLVGGGGSAWAETLIFTEDFSHETYNVNWGGTSAGGISPEIIDGMLRVANGSSNGDRSAYIAFGSNAYTGCSRLTFDMAMTKSGWSGKNNNFYVLPSATTDRYPSTTNAVLIISQDSEGAITVAGESLGKYDGVVLTYDLFLNTVTGFAKIVVKNGETEIKSFSYSTTAKGINTLHLTFNKNFGAFAIDNISLYSIIAPKFSLTSTEEVISVGGAARVDVSDIIGVVSVSSDNESVASSSYEDGVVTINGVSSGVANITVTATNDGLETSLTIVATVGEVAKTDVTITYLDENDIPIATSLIIEDVAVGSLLTSSEIIYEPVLYGTGVRYVNPVLEQSLPYTVVEDGVINIKYTKQAAVTSIQKIVKVADKELSRENILLEDKYVGDALSLSYPLYINDNGTLYAKNAISSSYCQSFTLTETSQECVLSYALSEITNVTYFSEAETIDGAIATSKGNNMLTRSSNQACAYAGNDIVMTNLPAGVYKATMVFYSNSSAGITLPFDFGGTEYNATASAANNWATATTDFTLYLASDIIWKKSGDSKNGLDFVYIQKIRDVSEAEIALANAKKKLGLAIEQAEGLYNAEKTGAEDLNTAMADASELLYGEQAGEATTETLTAALVSLTQAIGTYVYANMSDEMKQAVTLVADNDALTAANVANIVATAETTDSDELAALIIAAVTNDANGVEDLAAAIATAIITDDESGLADAIAAFEAANQPFNLNTLLVNGDFEGTYTNKISNSSGSNLRYVREPEGWTLSYSNGCEWDASILTEKDESYNNIKSKITIPAEGRGDKTYAVRLHGNAKNSQITLTQAEQTYPKGKYTLTGSFFTENQNELEVGFFFGSYSNDTRLKYTGGNNSWNTLTKVFESDGTYKSVLGVFFKHNSSNSMIAGADNITLTYENVNKKELAIHIARATAINLKLGTLSDEISTAQSVFDGINDTPDYQATIDNAITTLQNAIDAKVAEYDYKPAGDDVSTLLLDNPGFDIDINFSSFESSATSSNTVYPTYGWIPTVPGNCTAATIQYGYSGTINGDGNVTAPNKNADATTTGGALAICVGWSGIVTYKSAKKTFKAGSYRITYRTYNGNVKNKAALEAIPLVGFIPTEGESQINDATESFANQAWTTHTYSFSLAEDTEGQIQIGLQPIENTNSFNAPELFIDEVKLEYFDPLTLAQLQWQEVHDALANLDATVLPNAAESAITTELAKSVPTTVEDVNNAKDALQALIDSYEGIKAAYDKVNALITFVTSEKENSTATSKETIEEAISTATTNIETRTAADDLTSDYNTLETARQAYVLAAKPTDGHVFDYTFKIVDATITNKSNWNNVGTASGQQYTGAPDNTYMDCGWNSTTNGRQTVSDLPAGYYTLKAATRAASSDVTIANVYVNQERSELNSSTDNHRDGNTGGELGNGWSWTEVDFELCATGSISVGFYAQTTGQGWAGADDFHLYYKGNAVDDETVAALIATMVDGKMDPNVSTAQSTAKTTLENEKTIENYQALETAIANAIASVANYEALKAAIDKAEAVKVANNFVTVAAATSFANEITTATSAWIDVTYTDAQATAQIAALGTAVSEWRANATGVAGAYMASTWDKTNENWWDAPYINTWSKEGDNDGSGFSVPFFEYFTDENQNLGAKTMTATLTDLPNGKYQVEIWARVQRRSDADFNVNNSMITMSVNDGDAVSIMSNTSNNVGSGTSVMRLGRYTAIGDVTDGTLTLTIDVKLGANVHWLSWRDVKYTKLDVATMAVTDAKWATFVAPFDVEIPTEFTGEVYTVDNVEANVLIMNPVTTTIPANTPVVLYCDNVFSKVVSGVADPVENPTGGTLLTGVYAETAVPDGSYVLQNHDGKVAFYVVDAGVAQPKVQANHAYMTISGGDGARAYYFGGEATAIGALKALTSGDAEIYDVNGRKQAKLQKGVNIIRTKDGRTQKVMVK